MKKSFILIISFLVLVFSILTFQVKITNKNELGGKRLSAELYYYDLKLENQDLADFRVLNHEVYYLVNGFENSIGKTEFNKLDLYKNNITNIKTWDNRSLSCILENNLIRCDNILEEEFSIYDYKINLLYHDAKPLQFKSYIEFIPYKDTFLKIMDHHVYIDQNNEEKLVRELDFDSNTIIYNYFKTEDNTFILLYNFTEEEYYLYDYNLNTKENIILENARVYDNGFYFYNNTKILIKDLVNHKTLEYEKKLTNDLDVTFIEGDSNIFYFFDLKRDLYIINLEKATIKKYHNDLFQNKNILDFKVYNNVVYLNTLEDEKYEFYLIDLSKINFNEMTFNEYYENINKEINNLKSTLENDYNFKIHLKEDLLEFPDFSAEEMLDNDTILNAIKKMAPIINKYNKEFFSRFYHDELSGLNIYLTGKLTPSDFDTQLANPAAYSLIHNNEYMIVLDITQLNIEELLCHELLHNLENNINNREMFKDWNTLNPEDFYYNYSYIDYANNKYTMYEKIKEDVYFIDSYARTFPTEDRARVFEGICSCESNSKVLEYPNLLNKSLYLKNEILKYYPELENTDLFKSID